MRAGPALELLVVIPLETNLGIHVDAVNQSPGLHKREIERISVIGRHYGRFGILNVLKPSSYHSSLFVQAGQHARPRGSDYRD